MVKQLPADISRDVTSIGLITLRAKLSGADIIWYTEFNVPLDTV